MKFTHSISRRPNTINVKEGATVKEGDIIGGMGNTGNAAGEETHLHFQIRDSKGKVVDPGSQFGIGDRVKQFFRGALTGGSMLIPDTKPPAKLSHD